MRVRLGDTLANEVFRAHDQLVRAGIEAGGGTNIKGLGDGFMALFSSAQQAIGTAINIQRSIETHNQEHPERAISVRMGLNSGDVTLRDGEAHGTAVHAASRVAAKAQGGQILLSQIAFDLAGDTTGQRVVDRGLFWLKGFPDRWRLYEVLWREKEAAAGRATREVKDASAQAFDPKERRTERKLVGRQRERAAIEQGLADTITAGLQALVVEGEAGIGKTRLAEETTAIASDMSEPFASLYVTADEELRGPFLLFRSLLNSPRMNAVAREAVAGERLDRALSAISGHTSQGTDGLTPQEQMLKIFDEVTGVFASVASERPVVLLLDDLQWADEDSVQLIRYLVRTLPSAKIYLFIAMRPHSESSVGASRLIADLDRMRVTQVLRLDRLSVAETGELLTDLLGAPVDAETLSSLHARSEGVPFFIEEFARAYREANALQLMDGTWTMTKLTGPTVPSSVQSLIKRRLEQISDETRMLLSDAGVLGRRFRLTDLAPIVAQMTKQPEKSEWELADDLEDAVGVGLLVEEAPGGQYDYSFSHDQIRASLLDGASRRRTQAVHAAIAAMIEERPEPRDLSMLAYHTMKAGDSAKAVPAAIAAAEAALDTSAPEESLRLIDAALPAASDPQDRIRMLLVKDDALATLERATARVANLAEMTALAPGVGNPDLDADIKLRQSAAMRTNEDYETAEALATAVLEAAQASGNKQLELRASFELGQALTRAEIGEGYWPLTELDLTPPREAYERALAVAQELGSRGDEATALRELAVIEGGITRQKIAEMQAQGVSTFEILDKGPEMLSHAKELAEQSLRIFEEVGDKRGAMTALISMAYSHIADSTAHGMAGRIEHIRTLQAGKPGAVADSQRAFEGAHMLFSIQTYARLNGQPGLALERGQQAYEAARSLGDRWLETLTAGGMSMTYASIGDAENSTAWLDIAATAAMGAPSTAMAHRVAMWRGACAACAGNIDSMKQYYTTAAKEVTSHGQAARVEAITALAIELCKFGVFNDDPALIAEAKALADDVIVAVDGMKGDLPWRHVANAVLAVAADADGDSESALEYARTAVFSIGPETHLSHFINVLWAASRVLFANDAPETAALSQQIAQGLGYLSLNISDPEIRAKWFAMPVQSALAELAGFSLPTEGEESDGRVELTSQELDLLRELSSGGSDLDPSADDVRALMDKIDAENEIQAIEYAIHAGLTWQ